MNDRGHVMNWMFGIGAFFMVIGLLNKESGVVAMGIGAIGLATAWKLTKWGAQTTKSAVSNALSERKEEKDFQKNLRRKVQEERELAAVRNDATIRLLREQVALISEHKREGLNVEREIYTMREKLLEYERQENSAMIGDLIKTLDSI
jgi:hypothetical protein